MTTSNVKSLVASRFSKLQKASKYPIRQETNSDKSTQVIRIVGGTQGDVVGMNDTMRLHVCFAQGGNVVYVDYDT